MEVGAGVNVSVRSGVKVAVDEGAGGGVAEADCAAAVAVADGIKGVEGRGDGFTVQPTKGTMASNASKQVLAMDGHLSGTGRWLIQVKLLAWPA